MNDLTLTKTKLTLAFEPHPLIRNPHLQTGLASLYRAEAPALRSAAREMTLELNEGVRLQGFYSPQTEQAPVGVVLMLHGWLGSAEANYILAAGESLYRRGFAIFRLNFRDHGDTMHLNSGTFRSDLLDEVFDAARRVAALEPQKPLHIVGASLGGSFGLRVAWRHSLEPIANMGYTVAICPVVNPYRSTLLLDSSPFYLGYFRRKWRESFRRKQALYPDRYDFSGEIAARTCMAMTEAFMQNNGPYPDALTYFGQYTVSPKMMARLRSPVIILTAADDPIIPVEDFEPFQDISPYLTLDIQPYGGHVGFIDLFPYRRWLSQAVPQLLTHA